MKLVVLKTNFKRGLAIAERAISSNESNLPILKYILLEAVGGIFRITATNLEIAVMHLVSGKVIEDGKIAVPHALLSQIINNLNTERINLELHETTIRVTTDNYQADIQGIRADEFPIIPQIKDTNEAIEIKGELFKNILQQILLSTQYSNLRTELNAVSFHFSSDEIVVAGTDSFRLSEKVINKNQFSHTFQSPFSILIPLATIQELSKIAGDEELITLHKDQNQILFTTPSLRFISRLLEGTFPDYRAILPKNFETVFDAEILVSREELLSALKLVGVLSGPTGEVRIKVVSGKKSIEVCSIHQSLGGNTYTLPAKLKGAALEAGFNWRYLTDGLKALSTEEVFLGINEHNKPSLLKSPQDNSYFYVLMPLLGS